MFLRLGVLLGLVTFLLWNALASLLVAGLARRIAAWADRDRPALRARLLLVLRLLPAAASSAFVLGLFAPSYLLFEPEASGERPGARVTILALAALLLLACAAWRLVASLRATGRLQRSWRQAAQPLGAPALPAEAYRIAHPYPVVSVVGSLQPRFFVAGQVLAALSPAELLVALDHEAAHVASKDNLKRFAFACAPDVLGLLPTSRWLRREWERAVEASADAAAVRGDRRRALDLSAALVKVARLVPQGARLAAPAFALHDGEDIGYRVRRLLAQGVGDAPAPPASRGHSLALLAAASATTAALPLVALSPAVMRAVHELTELLFRLLG